MAAFVGLASRGPVDHALRLASAAELNQVYGAPPEGSFLAAAVHGFFANGGVTCWVVRAVDRESVAAAEAEVTGGRIRFEALSPGTWGNGMAVNLQPTGGGLVTVTVVAPDGRRELWRNLDLDGLRDHFSAESGSDQPASALLRVMLGKDAAVPAATASSILGGGCDGLEHLTPSHLAGDETVSSQLPHGVWLSWPISRRLHWSQCPTSSFERICAWSPRSPVPLPAGPRGRTRQRQPRRRRAPRR